MGTNYIRLPVDACRYILLGAFRYVFVDTYNNNYIDTVAWIPVAWIPVDLVQHTSLHVYILL